MQLGAKWQRVSFFSYLGLRVEILTHFMTGFSARTYEQACPKRTGRVVFVELSTYGTAADHAVVSPDSKSSVKIVGLISKIEIASSSMPAT